MSADKLTRQGVRDLNRVVRPPRPTLHRLVYWHDCTRESDRTLIDVGDGYFCSGWKCRVCGRTSR